MGLIIESLIFGLLLNPFTVLVLGGNLLLLIFIKYKSRKN